MGDAFKEKDNTSVIGFRPLSYMIKTIRKDCKTLKGIIEVKKKKYLLEFI
jgi:hypothetical protein